MTDIASGVAAQLAMTQQAVALEVLRQTANLQQQSISRLIDSVASVPVSAVKGTNVNISA